MAGGGMFRGSAPGAEPCGLGAWGRPGGNSGVQMVRANVGDKYVLEEMRKSGATLGGEQSGHVIFRDGEATTGDGLLTALRVMEIMVRSGKTLAELVDDLQVFPQIIQNIR